MDLQKRILLVLPEENALHFRKNKRKSVQVRSLRQLLYILTNIPPERINSVIITNFYKNENTVFAWLRAYFPDVFCIINNFEGIEKMGPSEIRLHVAGCIKRALNYARTTNPKDDSSPADKK